MPSGVQEVYITTYVLLVDLSCRFLLGASVEATDDDKFLHGWKPNCALKSLPPVLHHAAFAFLSFFHVSKN